LAVDVGLPAAAIASYAAALSRPDASRKRGVLVLNKAATGGRLRIRPAEEVGVVRHLYSVPAYDDPRAFGIALSMLQRPLGLSLGRPASDGELLSWAEGLAAMGVVREEMEQAVTRKVDNPAAAAVRRTRATGQVAADDVSSLARMMQFASARTPHWLAENREGLRSQALRNLDSFGPIPVQRRHFDTAEEFLALYARVAADTAFLLAVSGFIDDERVPLFAKPPFRLVLFDARAASVPFITCDNPLRPLNLAAVDRAHRKPRQPMRDPGVFALYPVAPTLMLAATTDRSFRAREVRPVNDDFVRRVNTALLRLAVSEVVLPDAADRLFIGGVDPLRVPPFIEFGAPMYAAESPDA
jgi:hypothetical protein